MCREHTWESELNAVQRKRIFIDLLFQLRYCFCCGISSEASF